MAQAQSTGTKSAFSNSLFTELGEIGKKRTEAMATAQAEFLKGLQEINQYWLARAKSEADLASELTAKLTGARSAPEIATACQECASRRMQMAVEDGQRLFADGFKLLETTGRIFLNGGTDRRG